MDLAPTHDVNAVIGGYLRDLAFAQASPQKMYGYKRAAAAIFGLDEPLRHHVVAGHHVQGPGRQSRLPHHLAKQQGGQGSLRSRLDENSRPDRQRGRHFVRDQIERKIEGRDAQHRTDRHPTSQAEIPIHAGRPVQRDDFSADSFRLLAGDQEGLNRARHLAPRIRQGLACLGHHQPRELFLPLPQDLCNLGAGGGAGIGREPFHLPRRRLHRTDRLLGGGIIGQTDFGDHLAVVGITDGISQGGRALLTPDEQRAGLSHV